MTMGSLRRGLAWDGLPAAVVTLAVLLLFAIAGYRSPLSRQEAIDAALSRQAQQTQR